MLYLMRHGQTDWNARFKLQGRTDVPLNEEGRHQARSAAKDCAAVHFDICYCSPLSRAKETAHIVLADRNIPIVEDERLMEMSFGVYEGAEHCFEQPENPVRELFFHPENYVAVEDGESFEQLYARTGSFLKEVVEPELAKGKDILIVAHGLTNLSIVAQMQNKALKDFWTTDIENCKLIPLA